MHRFLRFSPSLAILFFLTAASPLLAAEAKKAAPSLNRPWEDEILYSVPVPCFFNGNPSNDIMARTYRSRENELEGGYWGGDLAGVRQKLDYICGLGVTTLFLSPVVQNDRINYFKYLPGGYRPMNLFSVDENLGTLPELRRLVSEAHARGLRVIFDLPLAMPGIQHSMYTDENVARGWFGPVVQAYGLRTWNTNQPRIANYLIRAAEFWREQTGVDGFRIDSVNLLPDAFWVRFAKEVRANAPKDFFLWGEIVLHPSKIGQFLRETGFDSGYDFSFFSTHGVLGKGQSMHLLSWVFGEAHWSYPNPKTMCAALDNYGDTLLKFADNPKLPRHRLALALLFAIDRLPLLYAGDEIGYWPSGRYPGDIFAPAQANPALFADTKHLIALRKAQPALRRGAFAEVYKQDPHYAFLRILREDRILFVLSNSNQETKVRFPVKDVAWKDLALFDLWGNRPLKATGADDPLVLPPFGFAILKLAPTPSASAATRPGS